MLTSDLLAARVRRGRVLPFYLPVEGEAAWDGLARAEALIGIFAAHEGQRRGELIDALKTRTAGSPFWRLERGLAKLLEDKSTFRGVSNEAAFELRQEVFQRAAAARREGTFDRERILSEVAAGLAPEALELEAGSAVGVAELEDGLYGDLKRNERVVEVWRPTPRQLVDRYNLALAQACLLRAHALKVTVFEADPPRLRQLLRHVKFQGLLQAARRRQGKVVLELDGPLSIFGGTARYGVKMAGFLPALLLCKDWHLEAKVELQKSKALRTFELTPATGLVTHARDTGAWLPDLIEAFAGRFRELTEDWTIDREVPLLNLGGELIVPDFRFVHRDGFKASLEVLGYWRRGAVARRLELLEKRKKKLNLVLALDHTLKLGDEGLKGLDGPIVPFRDVPNGRTVLRCLERLRKGG